MFTDLLNEKTCSNLECMLHEEGQAVSVQREELGRHFSHDHLTLDFQLFVTSQPHYRAVLVTMCLLVKGLLVMYPRTVL